MGGRGERKRRKAWLALHSALERIRPSLYCVVITEPSPVADLEGKKGKGEKKRGKEGEKAGKRPSVGEFGKLLNDACSTIRSWQGQRGKREGGAGEGGVFDPPGQRPVEAFDRKENRGWL